MPTSPTPPIVSIGLAAYNGERYIAAAIESILAQTYGDFELVITDDVSTDATEEICRGYATRDPRVRYHRNERNLGSAPNFNRAFGLAAMRELVAGRALRCELDGTRTHDRCAGVCYLNGGADIAAMLVRQGLARDCPRYSGGRYAADEREAARAGATIGEVYRLPTAVSP